MALGDSAAAVTSTSPGTVAVGSSSSQAIAANAGRRGSQWVNASTVEIYLGLGAAAAIGSGIYLAASGGAWDGRIGPMVWTGSVYAIAASGSGNALCVVEV